MSPSNTQFHEQISMYLVRNAHIPNMHVHMHTIHTGEPSQPDNLHGESDAIPDDTPYIRIVWDPPVYTGGNESSIQMYRIRIPEINYSEEENGTAHTITADGTGVMFNTPYEVEVTAINTCGLESNPAVIAFNIEAGGNYIFSMFTIIIFEHTNISKISLIVKAHYSTYSSVFNAHVGPPLLTSLGATLQCSDGNSLKADLHWEVTTSVPCCISVLVTFNLLGIYTASHTCTQYRLVFTSGTVTISLRFTCYYPSLWLYSPLLAGSCMTLASTFFTLMQCISLHTLILYIHASPHWQYSAESSSVYTPPIETVTVEVDGPALVSADECSNLTPSNMNCSFNITEGGLYMVRLNTTNEIGTTTNENAFSCKWCMNISYVRIMKNE